MGQKSINNNAKEILKEHQNLNNNCFLEFGFIILLIALLIVGLKTSQKEKHYLPFTYITSCDPKNNAMWWVVFKLLYPFYT